MMSDSCMSLTVFELAVDLIVRIPRFCLGAQL